MYGGSIRGMPAGMTTTSAPVRASLRPSSLGRYPLTVCTTILAFHFYSYSGEMMHTYSNGGDMGEVRSNTWCIDDIVKREFINEKTGFEEEGKRLEIF